jgi:hypothetical protein
MKTRCNRRVFCILAVGNSARLNAIKMKYEEMPFKEWDGKQPLVLFNDDKYFFSEDEIEDYLVEINDSILAPENHKTFDDLQLVITEDNNLWELDFNDIYCDILPEDMYLEDVCSKELLDAMDSLNKIIRLHKGVSYTQGKFRTTYNNVIYLTEDDLNQE